MHPQILERQREIERELLDFNVPSDTKENLWTKERERERKRKREREREVKNTQRQRERDKQTEKSKSINT